MQRDAATGEDLNVRFFRKIWASLSAFVLLLCASISLSALIFVTRWRIQATLDDSRGFVVEWHKSIAAKLDTPSKLLASFAALSTFTAPQDYKEYSSRLRPLQAVTAHSLPADLVTNAKRSGYEKLFQGHLYRGLPLKSDNGRPLVRNQRNVAASMLKMFPQVDSVAEIDSLGRFVFEEPYSRQQSLKYFDIGKTAFFRQIRDQPGHWIAHLSLDDSGRQILSFAEPISRNQHVDGYLVLSIDASRFLGADLEVPRFSSEIAALSTGVNLPEAGEVSTVEFEDFGRVGIDITGAMLRYSPSFIRRILLPSASGKMDSPVCNLKTERDLVCVQSLMGGFPTLTTRIRLLFDPSPSQALLATCFVLLCIVATSSTSFGIRLFGSRWSRLAVKHSGFQRGLTSALDTVAHDSRQIIQNLRGEHRLVKHALREAERLASLIETIGLPIKDLTPSDLNQMLQTFLERIGTLQKDREHVEAIVRTAVKGTDRLARTIGQFELFTDDLTPSVLSHVGLDYTRDKVELFVPFFVSRAVAYYGERYETQGITLTSDCHEGGSFCFVSGHLAQFNRILGNLVINATEACKDTIAKRVSISVTQSDNRVKLRVQDTGCGMNPLFVEKLFDPSFPTSEDELKTWVATLPEEQRDDARGFFTAKGRKGRGQGLPSCKQLLGELGGTIEVEKTEVGKGTTFLVDLPSVQAPFWFTRAISVSPFDVLVFIDDDEDMQDEWRSRFVNVFRLIEGSVNGVGFVPRMEFVSDANELVSERKNLITEGAQFFVDYRLKNYHLDGLTLIDDYNLQNRAVLVTNHFHDPIILKRAIAAGVRVVPKEFLAETAFNLRIGGAE